MSSTIKSLLWGKPGRPLMADWAQRSAGELRLGSSDICGKPAQWLLPDITVSETSTSRFVRNVRDVEVSWSKRPK